MKMIKLREIIQDIELKPVYAKENSFINTAALS